MAGISWVKDTGVEVEAADRWMLYPGWGDTEVEVGAANRWLVYPGWRIQEWRWEQLTDGWYILGEGYRSGVGSS
jgi:hypothetical protein